MFKRVKIILVVAYFLYFSFLGAKVAIADNISSSLNQRLAAEPRDMAIIVRHNDTLGEPNFCYTPLFSQGEGYFYLAYCSSSSQKFRYDVFGRVSFNYRGKWLCMTAPSSVTGKEGKVTKRWDNLIIRPCVINDPNQKWKLIDHAFYTADGRFRVKDYGYYLYLSSYPQDYYDHHLSWKMHDWEMVVSRPGNLSIKTFVAWLFVDRTNWILYYLQNDKSTIEPVDLYYNPENQHIAQYNTGNGTLYCLTSNARDYLDWSWVSWENCEDNITKDADRTRAWELFDLYNHQGQLRDIFGNILRVTRYGTNWGTPYTVKPNYLQKDKTNSPTSTFIFSPDISNWNNYLYANLGDELEYCPAPGISNVESKKRVKRGLPENFELTEAWAARLWQIAISVDPRGSPGIGLCGPCLLQAYQMTLELISQARTGPVLHGGYFFTTAPDTNPFISFRDRFPELAHRFWEIRQSLGPLNIQREVEFSNAITTAVRSMTTVMLPNYRLRIEPMVFGSETTRLLQELLESPVGSLFIISFYRTNANGEGTGVEGHVMVALRMPLGVVLIPANITWSLSAFTDALRPRNDLLRLESRLTLGQTRRLVSLMYVQVLDAYENPLSLNLSQYNCSGDGEHRRGSQTLPSSSLVNQCATASGRCL